MAPSSSVTVAVVVALAIPERPVEKVTEDVRNGFLSPDKAEKDYGVVVDRRTLMVDTQRTQERRAHPVAS